jgi:hypothetical protein
MPVAKRRRHGLTVRILILMLALGGTDVEAQRRAVRIDAGAWDAFFPIDSIWCQDDVSGEPRVLLGSVLFAGLTGPDLLTGASCQYTRPAALNGETFTPGDQDGLAALIGPNADDVSGAMRYTFANDTDPLAASRAFQWYYHFLPGLTLVSLHLSVDGSPDVALDDSSNIIDLGSGTRLWGGGSDGYDGEYFCFRGGIAGSNFLGMWDGRSDGESTPCLDYIRLYRARPALVVSRDGFGRFTGAPEEPSGFDPRQRFVALSSVTRPDTGSGEGSDVFLFERATGTRRLLSARPDGEPANGSSRSPAIERGELVPGDAEDRWVAFVSAATDLAPGDPDSQTYVYLGRSGTPTLQRISRAAAGLSCDAPRLGGFRVGNDLGGGGTQRVAFVCSEHDGGFGQWRSLWLHEEGDDEPRRLWITPPGTVLGQHDLSADGRFVAFSTDAPIAADDENDRVDVYLLDIDGGGFTRVSTRADGGDGNGHADAVSLSFDGCVVAFHSSSTNLTADALSGAQNVFVRDRCNGTSTLVSVGLQGDSGMPSLSGDGRFVAFETRDPALQVAAGIVPGVRPAVAMRRLGAGAETRAVPTGLIAGSAFPRSAARPVVSQSNFHSDWLPTFRGDEFEGGHEIALSVTGANDVPQLAIVASPFERVYTPVFGDGFE